MQLQSGGQLAGWQPDNAALPALQKHCKQLNTQKGAVCQSEHNMLAVSAIVAIVLGFPSTACRSRAIAVPSGELHR